MSVDRALVLAGARPGVDPVAAHAGVAHKALIPLDGRPLLARVVGALRAAGIGRIAVSCAEPQVEALAGALGAETLPAQAGPSLSALRGVQALGFPVLVTTSDHALLQAEWVRAFVADAPPDADLCVLLADRALVEAAAPGGRRTWLRFADGQRAGCNLFLARTDRALAVIELWRTLEADRKRPWRIVRRLGVGALVSYLTGRLTLAAALGRLERLTGARLAAVTTPFGLAAVDVDKPEDLELARGLAAIGG